MEKKIKVVFIINEFELTLNIGKEDEVKIGDRFMIYSLSEHEIIDNETKESLGYLEFVKGIGKVIHLQEKMCTIESNKFKSMGTSKTVKRPKNNIYSSFNSQIEEIITENEPEQIPFEDPRIGDLAKKI